MMDFDKRFSKNRIHEFAAILQKLQDNIDFKVSARGWCYLMEQGGYINKNQFDKVEDALNRCRRRGILPVDFVAEEDARAFSGVLTPNDGSLTDTLAWMLRDVLDGHKYFTPELWEDEEYYIQVLVEKIDLKTMFEPICKRYAIPIANAKGWSSILQRAEYARRFKEAEDNGLKCVLLYCGDHDPDGLRISDTIRKNLEQVKDVSWSGGDVGYDPENIIVERFGLNYNFILRQKYTWIDNLVTGSGKGLDLSRPSHPNHKLPYVQDYLKTVGPRKCEANVLVTTPKIATDLMQKTIENYLGTDARARFAEKREQVKRDYTDLLNTKKILKPIQKIIKGL